MRIPDPMELMDMSIEKEIDKIDEHNTYPCCFCGKRYDIDTMYPIDGSSYSQLECGREDCNKINK